MRQIGTVERLDGKMAFVSVKRLSACEGCHKANPGIQTASGTGKKDVTYSVCHECSMFPIETEMTVQAENPIGAVIGDKVLLESSTSLILGYAAAVFLLPILLAAGVGILFSFLIAAVWSPYLGAVIGFVGAFAIVKLVFDRHARTHTTYTVIKTL